MKQYTYPAVFYKNVEEEGFVVAFDDIHLFCTGKTIEESFAKAKKLLTEYIKLSLIMEGDVEETPRSFEESAKIHKGEIVLLVTAEVDEGGSSKTKMAVNP